MDHFLPVKFFAIIICGSDMGFIIAAIPYPASPVTVGLYLGDIKIL
jgi:hypothetical protein